MEKERGAGILMPIFALPGEYGVGSFGAGAYRFADLLRSGGFRYWQVLPFCITDEFHSPYKSVSTFSINPWFIDLDILRGEGLLTEAECEGARQHVDYTCEYEREGERMALLFRAAERAQQNEAMCARVQAVMERFPYLEELCRYMAKKRGEPLPYWQFLQAEALRQWLSLKEYVNALGISVIGDLPIYVSFESSEVEYHKDWFLLDEKGNPTAVAGVPPDYFCREGQLWGNPLYDFEAMRRDGFSFFRDRISYMLALFDGLRIDHFRALSSFFAVPAGAKTAREGRWIPAPGKALIDAIRPLTEGRLVIAEDLGNITEEVVSLVQYSGFPGMRVLQFGLSSENDRVHLPHFYEKNTVAYTGTHDNNTLLGFMFSLPEWDRARVLSYLGREGEDFGSEAVYGALTRSLLASAANTVILPMQDLLLFGEDTRFNTPGRSEGNWAFRFSFSQCESAPWDHYASLLRIYNR